MPGLSQIRPSKDFSILVRPTELQVVLAKFQPLLTLLTRLHAKPACLSNADQDDRAEEKQTNSTHSPFQTALVYYQENRN